MPVRPFLPPALLHYEHRLALDYQRQIHEHLNAQAQLLRHMSMDIIPSESGSERSSSAASDCCSPEIMNRSSVDGHQRSEQGHTGSSSSAIGSAAGSKSGKSANGTPLDALFQMTSKTFDEQQNESSSGKCGDCNELRCGEFLAVNWGLIRREYNLIEVVLLREKDHQPQSELKCAVAGELLNYDDDDKERERT